MRLPDTTSLVGITLSPCIISSHTGDTEHNHSPRQKTPDLCAPVPCICQNSVRPSRIRVVQVLRNETVLVVLVDVDLTECGVHAGRAY